MQFELRYDEAGQALPPVLDARRTRRGWAIVCIDSDSGWTFVDQLRYRDEATARAKIAEVLDAFERPDSRVRRLLARLLD